MVSKSKGQVFSSFDLYRPGSQSGTGRRNTNVDERNFNAHDKRIVKDLLDYSKPVKDLSERHF